MITVNETGGKEPYDGRLCYAIDVLSQEEDPMRAVSITVLRIVTSLTNSAYEHPSVSLSLITAS